MAHGPVSDTRVLLDGFGMGESPRWHESRLWFSSWGTDEIIAVDLEGSSEVIGAGGGGSGWAVNWLRDGRMLVTGGELLRIEADASRVRHADLRQVSPYGWSEITVDGRGNAYVNSLNFDFADFTEVLASGAAPGKIALVTADGTAREVADGLAFPNGMAVTPDNGTLIVAESYAKRLTAFDVAADGSLSNRRVWADLGDGVPDGICLDAEGAVWVASPFGHVVVRVLEGGEVTDRIDVGELNAYACMLGGPNRTTLFICVGPTHDSEEVRKLRGARIDAVDVTVPGAGWP